MVRHQVPAIPRSSLAVQISVGWFSEPGIDPQWLSGRFLEFHNQKMHYFIDHKAVATPHSVSASRKPKLHELVSMRTTELECVFERQKDMKMVVATRH
jgi:hypothetical protein